jgi:hypothetical protein
LLAYRTTGKRPAFPVVSRPYRIGYNALAVLVLVMLPPLPSLDPLSEGKRSGQSFIIQLLKCVFSFSSSNKKS